jgi:hypothetical protein
MGSEASRCSIAGERAHSGARHWHRDAAVQVVCAVGTAGQGQARAAGGRSCQWRIGRGGIGHRGHPKCQYPPSRQKAEPVGLCAGTGLRLSVRSCSLVQHGQIAYASRHELTQLWLLHADQPGPGDRPLLGYHEDQAHLPAARNPKQEKRRAMRRQGTKRTIPCGPRTPSQPVGPRMPRSPGSPGSPCFPCGPVAPRGPCGPGPPTGPCNATARAELDTTQRMEGDTNWMGLAALSVFHQRPSWRIKNKGDTAQTQKHTDTATART